MEVDKRLDHICKLHFTLHSHDSVRVGFISSHKKCTRPMLLYIYEVARILRLNIQGLTNTLANTTNALLYYHHVNHLVNPIYLAWFATNSEEKPTNSGAGALHYLFEDVLT
jgi:hypothetical protein